MIFFKWSSYYHNQPVMVKKRLKRKQQRVEPVKIILLSFVFLAIYDGAVPSKPPCLAPPQITKE